MTKKAFTLVELVIVIVIIGILATVIIYTVFGAKEKAQHAKIKLDISAISEAVNIHLLYHGTLPPSFSDGVPGWNLFDDNVARQFVDDNNFSLLEKAPIHPKGGSNCEDQRRYAYCFLYITDAINSYFYIQYATLNASDPDDDEWRKCAWYFVPEKRKDCDLSW